VIRFLTPAKRLKRQFNFPTTLAKFSILILFFLSGNLFAQLNRTSYNILGISVEGNNTADATTIIANSGLREGKEIEIPGDATNDAIKRLWALGIFEDIQIIIDKKVSDGVFLLIKVKELSRVEKTIIRGNDELDEDDIEKEISFVSGQTLKPQEINRIILKVKDLYEEDGFLNAKITPLKFDFAYADTSDDEITVVWKNLKDEDDEEEIVYDYNPESRSNIINRIKDRLLLVLEIEEGEEVVVRSINFEGNEAFDDDDLEGEFDETSADAWWRFWSSSNFKKDDYETDKELLKTFYQRNGYRDFEILSDSINLSEDKKWMDIALNIYEGPQYKLRNIKWVGNTVYPDKALTERLSFSKGDIYNYELFTQNLYGNQAQTDVASLYLDNGYLTFRQEAKEEKVGEDSIDVIIKVSENNQFRIGKVDITGNDRTKDKVIRRELFTVPGDYFRRSNIFRSIQQLANLNYFNVEHLYQKGVDYRPANDSIVNLIYNVEEKSSDFINASVGYSGSWGFSGSLV
jgi:outer membrane protein insertion porin family